jgi:ribosomal protein S18 acetylase RimI-like enzyme
MKAAVELRPLSRSDIPQVPPLARVVWEVAYREIITPAQIDYMLTERYSDRSLAAYLGADDRWFELAWDDGRLSGFCACEIHNAEYKLDKLYVHPQAQRRGIGGALIESAAQRARALGFGAMILAVNKRNAPAIAAYRQQSFHVRDSVCVDIGNGFLMDDFIMEKKL